MSEEKIINRDIVYISDNSFLHEMKSLYDKSDKITSFLDHCDNNLKKTEGLSKKVYPFFFGKLYRKESDDIQKIPICNAKTFFNNEGIEVKGISNFSIGMILAKHPFLKNTYVNIDSLETEILHHKLVCLSSIAQFLGAKSISGHAIIAEEQKRCRSITGNLTYKVINGNVQGKTEEHQKYESKYSLDDTFTGEFSQESYEHAKEEAEKFGLNDDIEIQNLIDQRNPEHSTSIVSRKLTIELSREYNKAIDTAFSLSVPGIKLNAGYKGILESRKTILFTMETKF